MTIRAVAALVLAALTSGMSAQVVSAETSNANVIPRTVWAFGSSSAGAMGDGYDTSPHPIRGLGRMVAVDGGSAFTLALDAQGRVFHWGSNSDGVRGNGTHGNGDVRPGQVAGLPKISAIAAGENHVMALAIDGTVWAWGANFQGQIGNGQKDQPSVDLPFHVPGLSNVVAISGGGSHSLAVLANGTLMAWGNNGNGQLGTATDVNTPVTQPTPVVGATGVVKASAGGSFSSALKNDGTMYAWGSNYSSESSGSAAPQLVSGVANATDIETGRTHNLVLRSDGRVLCFGANWMGQCGNTTTPQTSTPTVIPELEGIIDLAAGIFTSYALDNTGRIWGWGDDSDGQLGDGPHNGANYTPRAAAGLPPVAAIDAGSTFGLALAITTPAFAVGAGPGGGPHVQVFESTSRKLLGTFYPYASNFSGGVEVALGDVNGDGDVDVITGPGPGGGPHIRVFATNGSLISEFMAFDPSFPGGVKIATADTNGDGTDEIVVGAGPGGGPHVRVFDALGHPVGPGFFAYGDSFHGGVDVAGVRVGANDVIVTGAGPGGGPHVRMLDINGDPAGPGFFAYAPDFHGGVFVAAGKGSGSNEVIVTGPGVGGGSQVRRFATNGAQAGAFDVYAPNFNGGVDVAGFVGGTEAFSAIVTGPGPGGGPHVRGVTSTGAGLFEFFAYAPNFNGGVHVAGERI